MHVVLLYLSMLGYAGKFDFFPSPIPVWGNRTMLYLACCNGHHDVVHTLLGAGADVNIATSPVSDNVLLHV